MAAWGRALLLWMGACLARRDADSEASFRSLVSRGDGLISKISGTLGELGVPATEN